MTVMKSTDSSPQLLNSSRSRYLNLLVLVLMFASGITGVGLLVANIQTSQDPAYIVICVVGLVVNGFTYAMLQRGYSNFATYVCLTEVTLGMLLTMSIDFTWLLFYTNLVALTSAVLASRNLYRLISLIVFSTILVVIVRTVQSDVGITGIIPYLVLLATLIISSLTTRYFTNEAVQTAQVAANSANLLQAAAATGEIIGKSLKLDDVLQQAVELIRERFAFYHVQIFLLDDTGENAQLAASTGSVGQLLFERHHSLPVGSRSVIGRVTSTMQPVTARDTDSFYHRNELLPNTRSELALPIMDGDKIIGALDVQSRRYEVFTNEVIQAMQVLANQLGITIRNARLFEAQDKIASDARKLFLESQTNLREIQRLNQQLTREGWQDFLENAKQVSGVTLQNDEIRSTAEWSQPIIEAAQTRQIVATQQDGSHVIAVPMMLGNEVIGAIEVEADASAQEADIREMVNAVAQRLALNLDKARLFEESQEATAREQRINEIVTRFQSVNNVDELLRITLQELTESLGATSSNIRLATLSNASLNGESHL